MVPGRIAETRVDYPSGAVTSTGTIVHLSETDDARVVVLDRTAFHPVDTRWPDQPADRGRLILADGTRAEINDAVVGAHDGERLHIGEEVPVRTGTEGWTFVVAHVVAQDAPVAEGDTVTVEVDAGYRTALSLGHTACHLASLALDRALADAWTKDAPADALGSPAFDQLAIERSEILENGARDTYRIGKSLRKKGFAPAVFDDPSAVADAVNAQLAAWVVSDAAVHVEAPAPASPHAGRGCARWRRPRCAFRAVARTRPGSARWAP